MRKSSWALLALLVLTAGACPSHARILREAEDAFSLGAQIDNEIFTGISVPRDSRTHYAMALERANKVITSHESDLRQDGLYGTALTVRALAAWRMGKYNDALKDALAVVNQAGSLKEEAKIWPRDLGLCVAVPGLVEIDRLGAQARRKKIDKPLKYVDSMKAAKKALRDGAQAVPKGHKLRVYLAVAELQLLNVLLDGYGYLPPGEKSKARALSGEWKTDSLKRLKGMGSEAPSQDAAEAIQKAHKFYTDRLR